MKIEVSTMNIHFFVNVLTRTPIQFRVPERTLVSLFVKKVIFYVIQMLLVDLVNVALDGAARAVTIEEFSILCI